MSAASATESLIRTVVTSTFDKPEYFVLLRRLVTVGSPKVAAVTIKIFKMLIQLGTSMSKLDEATAP